MVVPTGVFGLPVYSLLGFHCFHPRRQRLFIVFIRAGRFLAEVAGFVTPREHSMVECPLIAYATGLLVSPCARVPRWSAKNQAGARSYSSSAITTLGPRPTDEQPRRYSQQPRGPKELVILVTSFGELKRGAGLYHYNRRIHYSPVRTV